MPTLPIWMTFGDGMLSQGPESKANCSHVSSMELGPLRKPLLPCSQPCHADIITDSLSDRCPGLDEISNVPKSLGKWQVTARI